jgi:hypothetical protein
MVHCRNDIPNKYLSYTVVNVIVWYSVAAAIIIHAHTSQGLFVRIDRFWLMFYRKILFLDYRLSLPAP